MPGDDAVDERTSLLSNHTNKVDVNTQVERRGTLKDEASTGFVGSIRGLSIVLCLWLLIFLQGIVYLYSQYIEVETSLLIIQQLRMSRYSPRRNRPSLTS